MAGNSLAVDYATLVRAAARKLGTGQVYSTGTVTVAAGSVTISGGSWPSWAATACLCIGDRSYHPITSRTSSTQLAIADTSASFSAGSKYVLLQTLSEDAEDSFRQIDELVDQAVRRFYSPNPLEGQQGLHHWTFINPTLSLSVASGESSIELPDGCSNKTKEWTLELSGTVYPLALVKDGQMRAIKSANASSTGPRYVSIRPLGNDETGQKFQAIFDSPLPAAGAVSCVYTVEPERLSPNNPYPYGGAIHSETVLASVLAACEKFAECVDGMHFQEYQRRLAASIQVDRAAKVEVDVSYTLTSPTRGSYQWFQQEIAQTLGLSPNYNSWDHNTIQQIDSYIQRGLRIFWQPPTTRQQSQTAHKWSFLRPEIEINLHAPYTTGTIAVASGVVTLTGGTFPSWAASGELVVSGTAYHISSRDSNTQATLVDTEVTVSSGTSYSLQQTAYPLPATAATVEGPLHYRRANSNYWTSIQMVDMHYLRRLMQDNYESASYPRLAAVKLHNPQTTAVTSREIVFWPPPDSNYTVLGSQRAIPAKFTTGYPPGSEEHCHTMLYAMLSIADPKQYYELFLANLEASISHDQAEHTPESMGMNYDRGNGPEFYMHDEPRRYSSFVNNL